MTSDQDHDLITRVKSLVESFIREVQQRFITIDKTTDALSVKIDGLRIDISLLQKDFAVFISNCSHCSKDVSDFNEALKQLSEDLKTAQKAMQDYTDKQVDKAVEENNRSIAQWIAIATIIAGAVGTVLGAWLALFLHG